MVALLGDDGSAQGRSTGQALGAGLRFRENVLQAKAGAAGV
ncbi:hypothetical protein CSC44_5617 [Pseudomonas aeruginosa]|nr:hypothetical protein CSC44_5617 [Pseudomonas aeruginosa]